MCRPMVKHAKRSRARDGMTLVELLIAVSIMAMIAGSLGAMARAIQVGAQFSEGHGAATQHARVTLEQIGLEVSKAAANDNYPGLFVVAQSVAGQQVPDTLVVWQTTRTIDQNTRPLLRELVIFCPDRNDKRRLVRVTAPLDNQLAMLTDTAAVRSQIESMKTATSRVEVDLTDLLRTVSINGAAHAAVRFEVLQSSLPAGLKQVRLRTEMQLMPGKPSYVSDPTGGLAIPFLGSASVYYSINRLNSA